MIYNLRRVSFTALQRSISESFCPGDCCSKLEIERSITSFRVHRRHCLGQILEVRDLVLYDTYIFELFRQVELGRVYDLDRS